MSPITIAAVVLMLLDRALAQYGPETKDVRAELQRTPIRFALSHLGR